MKRVFLSAVTSCLLALTLSGQQSNTIGYSAVSCVRAGEMTVLQVNVSQKGNLRAYFRRVNTTDWCSVEGSNLGPISSVTLPKFDVNDQIEYYFLLLSGKQVLAKSPQIYRVNVTNQCDTPFARHVLFITMDCSEHGPGSTPASAGAGYSVRSHVQLPPDVTPSTRQ